MRPRGHGLRRQRDHSRKQMAKVTLKNVKKIYPYISGEEKKAKKKKKG